MFAFFSGTRRVGFAAANVNQSVRKPCQNAVSNQSLLFLTKLLQVSHSRPRAQNNCLNCNAVVHGRFCHICGQENIETKESLWQIISHFFQDITHFDGKFFSSLRHLLFSPGLLSREYMAGRRNSYLHPIRMYVFTSAFYFLFFFKFVGQIKVNEGDTEGATKQIKQTEMAITSLRKQQTPDTVVQRAIAASLTLLENQVVQQRAALKVAEAADSVRNRTFLQRRDSVRRVLKGGENFSISSSGNSDDFNSVIAYDMVQSQLPPDRRDGWWKKIRKRKQAEVIEKNQEGGNKFGAKIGDTFLHTLPQMFFLSLPFFAFGLWLLYRRHKQYFYSSHAIFSIHLYCGVFIISFFIMLLNLLLNKFTKDWTDPLTGIGMLIVLFYEYKCMRHFYGQRRGKTILKFVLICLYSLLIMALLATGFAIFSFWSI